MRRGRIVRSEGGGEAGVYFKVPAKKLQRVAMKANIHIQENQDISGRLPCSEVARICRASARPSAKNLATPFHRNRP
jgi:hypothetical protein